MGQRFSRDEKDKDDDIISQRSLNAVHMIIDFLKENVRAEGMFRVGGRSHTRRRILAHLQRGDRSGLRVLLRGAPVESAAALQSFLLHLRRPLIPARVQRLVLAENPGVPEQMVACDALGLLRQDLSGRHLELLAALLDLLWFASRNATSSELRGNSLPVALLPVFFDLQPADLGGWRHAAATFHELIMTAPAWLAPCAQAAKSANSVPPCARRAQDQTMDVAVDDDDEEEEELARQQDLPPLARGSQDELNGDRLLVVQLLAPPPVNSRLHPLLNAMS